MLYCTMGSRTCALLRYTVNSTRHRYPPAMAASFQRASEEVSRADSTWCSVSAYSACFWGAGLRLFTPSVLCVFLGCGVGALYPKRHGVAPLCALNGCSGSGV